MHYLSGWLGLILGFSGLIFIHELGHFFFAKWNGVKVLVFSIGMGPYLVSVTYRGTVYALSLIPIGGYVKMLGQDDLNADVGKTRNSGDFRNKKPGQKAMILVGGALFNILLTILIFAVCYFQGTHFIAPRLGNITPETPLSRAVLAGTDTPANLKSGDRVLEVNGVPVKQFIDIAMQVAATPRDGTLILRVERQEANPRLVYVAVAGEHDKKLALTNIGLEHPYEEEVPLPLGFSAEVQVFVAEDPANPEKIKETKTGPAALSGKFRKADRILALEDRTDPSHVISIPMDNPYALINAAAASKGKERVFILERAGKREEAPVSAALNEKQGGYKFGLVTNVLKRVVHIDPKSEAAAGGLKEGDLVAGFEPDKPNELPWTTGTLFWLKTSTAEDKQQAHVSVPNVSLPTDETYKQSRVAQDLYRAGPIGEALSEAWDDTRRYTMTIFATIRGLFSGDVGLGNLSGPVGIGQNMFSVASQQTFLGFLWFLGYISLNLGVMQLLPIPILDGFHLLLVGIEKIKGSAVSAKVQEKLLYAGILIIGSLFLFVMYNDIARNLH